MAAATADSTNPTSLTVHQSTSLPTVKLLVSSAAFFVSIGSTGIWNQIRTPAFLYSPPATTPPAAPAPPPPVC